jgi:hypothetical protein
MKYRFLKFFFILIFCFSSVRFFIPAFIPVSLLYYAYYALFLVAFLLVILRYRDSDYNVFVTPMLLLLIAIIISCFSANISWSQSLINSFKTPAFYLSYILFFLLIIWKMRVPDIEKIIIILGVIYIIVFAIEYYSYPKVIFGENIEKVTDERGFERIMLGGEGFLFLFSFYTLNKYLLKRNSRWLIIYIITLISIIMTLTRTLIAVSFILSTLYILRKSNYLNKIMAVFFIICFIYLFTKMNFYNLLLEQTVTETQNINDNIRIKSALFYLIDFSPNNFARVFGNGIPYEGSSFSRYSYFLENELGFYQTDIGYIGLYSKFGLLAILAYIVFIYRTVKISIPDDYLYCKYFLYFVFIISIIINAPFSPSFIPSVVLAAYILYSNDLSSSKNDEKYN